MEVDTMANNENLRVLTSEEAREIGRKGGIASGKARNYRKEQVENLKKLLDQTNNDGLTYREAMNLGVLKGALDGKAENFKTIIEYLEDNNQNNTTPIVEINIVDNSNLEKVMYEKN